MPRDIWLISDTHFNHDNVLNFTDSDTGKKMRTFSSVNEMNEYMIDRWNSVIKPGDKVYHLGDVVISVKGWMESNFNRLNGSKRLIVGNHDDIKYLSSGGWFKKVYMWRYFKDFNLLLTHVPIHPTTIIRGKDVQTINVHGHIHSNKSPDGPYVNVSVEAINYTPVHIESVLTLYEKGLV